MAWFIVHRKSSKASIYGNADRSAFDFRLATPSQSYNSIYRAYDQKILYLQQNVSLISVAHTIYIISMSNEVAYLLVSVFVRHQSFCGEQINNN